MTQAPGYGHVAISLSMRVEELEAGKSQVPRAKQLGALYWAEVLFWLPLSLSYRPLREHT